MSTEPTIPRQPIKPTFFIAFFSCKGCVLIVQASIELGYASHYKMLPKSQAKLIDDCPAIRKSANHRNDHNKYQG
ncbi:hypothetical protein [Enterobacter sp.]|nr:hypothetical protein [Enterobacter sp.]MDU4185424.1 hypothetical protein [Enterobacter sp.]